MVEISSDQFYPSTLEQLEEMKPISLSFPSDKDSQIAKGFGADDVHGESTYVDLIVGREKLMETFVEYLDEIKKIGLIDSVVVGVNKEGKLFLWNVFKEEFNFQSELGGKFHELNKANNLLLRRLEPITSLRFRYFNSKKLPILLKACEEKGIEVEVIEI